MDKRQENRQKKLKLFRMKMAILNNDPKTAINIAVDELHLTAEQFGKIMRDTLKKYKQ